MKMIVERLRQEAVLPTRAYDGDLCFDIYAAEDAIVPHLGYLHGDRAGYWPVPTIISTGLAIQLPPGYGAVLRSRSGLAGKGIMVMAGEIDNGYRGEIKVLLASISPRDDFHQVTAGDRVAQLRLVKLIECEIEEGEADPDTNRGEKGFGSTGA